jgi:Zn-finger nucleic acid-binding protein
MADASSLHCPNCGAAADPEAPRCPYCHASLATVSCPSCFEQIFDGALFCPKCGARRERTENEEAPVFCPGCASPMRRVDVGATPLLECRSCDGVWVDADVFERLCADQESRAAVLHQLEPRSRTSSQGNVRYRKCVRCGTMMNRVNFGRLSGTVVDVCRGHGTFLDGGELHQIAAFIQAGGLERARQRSIDDLREEEHRLRDLEARQARHAADSHGEILHRSTWNTSDLLDLLQRLRRS